MSTIVFASLIYVGLLTCKLSSYILPSVPRARRFNLLFQGLVKLKIDVIDEDDDEEFDFVDHYEYQYVTRDLRREIDTAPKSLVLSGSRTR